MNKNLTLALSILGITGQFNKADCNGLDTNVLARRIPLKNISFWL